MGPVPERTAMGHRSRGREGVGRGHPRADHCLGRERARLWGVWR